MKWMLRTRRGVSGTALAGRRQPGSGFGLVEMMVSLCIVSIMLTAFMDSITAARVIFRHGRYLTAAMAIGDQLTEELLLMDGSDPALEIGTHARPHSVDGHAATSGNVFYTAQWTVADYPAVSGMRRLDLRVSWQEHGSARYMAWTTFRN